MSFTLDRYGHLFPGSERKLNDALDAMVDRARSDDADGEDDGAVPNEGSAIHSDDGAEPDEGPTSDGDGAPPGDHPPGDNGPGSIAHVARTGSAESGARDNEQPDDQGVRSGRCGTRTHDLSRVKAAL